MRAKFVCAAAVITLLIAAVRMPAQEVIPAPAPLQPKVDAGVNAGYSANNAPAGENWRYRRAGGRWWYWTPQNQWMWYGDDGRWMEYYPGAAGGQPYDDTHVAVGRRIGVDVWGPHGDVRVGRIFVGW